MPPPKSMTIDAKLDEIDLDVIDFSSFVLLKKILIGNVFEASRASNINLPWFLLVFVLVNVNARDRWDSAVLYDASLVGHLDATPILLKSGAICSEHTFDGDRY
ncbi:hypothetical protein Ddye_001223 [Dipteronia dyeriana]|uniref:Uncharacterized protein n=1 Tax=Dipteronia dyeriana TaxID=168575 RepID=A0AAE0CTB6_9ROSI|nr:hypothetical protein Ddye_001223 [Dipteronia dyeriana]